MTPLEAHCAVVRLGLLPMWIIYERPTDYPTGFIARMHVSGHTHGPTTAFVTGATLGEVRQQLPEGVYCIGRQPGDEPQIIEVWL